MIDPHPIIGSGPDGRVVERDVKAYLDAKDYRSLRVSPAAKVLAAREGLDLLAIREGDAAKRIEVADVERAIAEKPKPLSRMRQIIAERLTHSVVSAPHFYVTVEVDMTNVLACRTRLNDAGGRYSITDFVAEASVLALREFPTVNSVTDGRTVRWHSRVHLGIAVNLDQGLVVPVIRDADELTFAALSERSRALVERARAGGLVPRRDERLDLHHLEHGHARCGELHRDHQSGRSRRSWRCRARSGSRSRAATRSSSARCSR